MSNQEIQRKINAAKMAVLPIPEAHRLLNEVATSIANDEQATNEPYGSYVARHLGALFARFDALAEDASVTQGGELPTISIGHELYDARTQQRVAFGDPCLQGTTSLLNPDLYTTGLEGAYSAQEATAIVQRHVGQVYATWLLS